MLNSRLKIILFSAGLLVLFLILQYDFTENDSWESWNLPLSGKIILLDAGHGGPDGGAGSGKTLEKDIALSITLMVRDYLQEQGALVVMTRETDTDLADPDTRGYSRRKVEDLKKRLQMINNKENDFFVSIHLNAIPSSRWSGAQTFYAPHHKENARAAKFIQDELRKNLENTHRKAKPINEVYILKHAKKPGVLVEVGFLSNPTERENLKKKEYQEKVAASIYKGILRYFTNEKELKETD
ncbi:N-acetylmuramoyl-L-alanine amidase CwlD [Neobacillus thermocopriae]|uniref:N-acetylmuramoyl-L-alanine amidase CwlD n=1 Tax=Neobacillus thermocopriae TaxID=1215031 RepID=A0A6B3TQT8_9BACI|nr:N-acetylmuramoyl-L-alanine amidase CwlD [Neobacillus thermocopriae]AIM16717.1 N-acetylmuramoyl-L-alanine amidase [Bacillus sp. X1(2014)]MED3623374.1 N-acetylmuramoyl-L-alanine amidase CwlD [Neobacillus thermocopriae]MED3713953.1 N-acetylmuramoyl-L-alanine amidase CwlD [Neobacillus thermocopriae]NEX79335.1 N-acetylmuramoyl-L-alanine amidase CwlD [Neobacillus thermocopriae]